MACISGARWNGFVVVLRPNTQKHRDSSGFGVVWTTWSIARLLGGKRSDMRIRIGTHSGLFRAVSYLDIRFFAIHGHRESMPMPDEFLVALAL